MRGSGPAHSKLTTKEEGHMMEAPDQELVHPLSEADGDSESQAGSLVPTDLQLRNYPCGGVWRSRDLWTTTLGKRVGSSPRKGGTAMTPGEGQCVAVRFPTDPVVNTLATARALCWDPME